MKTDCLSVTSRVNFQIDKGMVTPFAEELMSVIISHKSVYVNVCVVKKVLTSSHTASSDVRQTVSPKIAIFSNVNFERDKWCDKWG